MRVRVTFQDTKAVQNHNEAAHILQVISVAGFSIGNGEKLFN